MPHVPAPVIEKLCAKDELMSSDFENKASNARIAIDQSFANMLEKDKRKRDSELASIKTAELSAQQLEYVRQATQLAQQAQIEAENAKKDTAKAASRAFWSNTIAAISLVIALVSLGLSFFQFLNSGT